MSKWLLWEDTQMSMERERNSGTEVDQTTGQWVLGMGSGFLGILRGTQKSNLTTNIPLK